MRACWSGSLRALYCQRLRNESANERGGEMRGGEDWVGVVVDEEECRRRHGCAFECVGGALGACIYFGIGGGESFWYHGGLFC